MEYATWNGRQLSAAVVGKEYGFEKEVRMASARGELMCQDPTCQNKIVRYCHGKIKLPYFAHLENAKCDYAEYERGRSEEIARLCTLLYDVLYGKGISIQKEVKLLSHHYSHLVVQNNEWSQTAIEIIKRNFSANRAENLVEEYRGYGIQVIWIELGDVDQVVEEESTYFAQRFALNEDHRTLLVVDQDLRRAAEYRMDDRSYIYMGEEVLEQKEIFFRKGFVDQLTYENGQITFPEFDSQYREWQQERKEVFERKCREYEERMRHFKQVEEQTKKERERLEEERRKREEQRRQDHIIFDSSGRRVIKCECCQKMGNEELFDDYGGFGAVNLGICKECRKQGKRRNMERSMGNRAVGKEERERWGTICPECGAKLVERHGRNGAFLGCSGFPRCRYTRSIGRGRV